MKVHDLAPDVPLNRQLRSLLERHVLREEVERATLSFTDYQKLVAEIVDIPDDIEGPKQLVMRFPLKEGEREWVHLVAVSPLIGQAPNTLCVRDKPS